MAPKHKPSEDPRFRERDDDTVKIWATRPPETVVGDLRTFVRQTGTPDLWRWHLNTRPPANGPVPRIICNNIDIPESLRAKVGMAPCPICSITAPKYFQGMLAWYEQEKALRVIGRECGHKFYGQEFAAAKLRLKKEQEGDADCDFLIANLPKVARFLQIATELAPVAEQHDKIRHRVLTGLSRKTAKALHQHITLNNGLGLFEDRPLPVLDRVGNILTNSFGEARTTMSSVLVARRPIAGWGMLAPRVTNASALIYRAALNLERLNLPSEDHIADALVEWGFEGMGAARKDITESWKLLSQALSYCADVQAFLTEANLQSLMEWSFDPRVSINVDLRKTQWGSYEFRHAPHTVRVIPSVPDLNAALPTLPPLS